MSLLIQLNGKQILLKTVYICFHFSEIKKLRNIEINDFSIILQIFGFPDFFNLTKIRIPIMSPHAIFLVSPWKV